MLAEHNLYVSFAEVSRVKQAIIDGSLWELTAQRCRSHPRLLSGLERLLSHSGWLAERDPVTKRSSFSVTGFEAEKRTEVVNARERIKRVTGEGYTTLIHPFGEVPAAVADLYPFGSVMTTQSYESEFSAPKVRDIHRIRAIADYQFGSRAGELIPDGVRVRKSRKTRRIRQIFEGKELLAAVRASDHFLIPHDPLLEKLHDHFPSPSLRVVVDEEAVPFIEEGRSVFAKFVLDVDPMLRAGDEVLVVAVDDHLIRGGTLALSPQECLDFTRGVAARVR